MYYRFDNHFFVSNLSFLHSSSSEKVEGINESFLLDGWSFYYVAWETKRGVASQGGSYHICHIRMLQTFSNTHKERNSSLVFSLFKIIFSILHHNAFLQPLLTLCPSFIYKKRWRRSSKSFIYLDADWSLFPTR